jgi:O-antigen/teichoic acid export membrane protein
MARPSLTALRSHLNVPLFRDGYALVANEGVTAVLGLVYWLIAAREYTPRTVGVNTAAISAMMFIAGVAQLNLMSTLLRFVGVMGAARRRFIAVCYAVAAVAAVVCALVFLVGLGLWAPALDGLAANAGMVAWFVAATVAWCVFNLQDSALTGLGAAAVVPVSNGVYGVAKVGLLVAFVALSPHWGVYGSWTAGLLFVVFPVNAFVFRRAARRRAAGEASAPAPTRSDIVRFAGPDYIGALLWLAAMTLMPVIVVGIAGPTETAYFSVAWMLSGPLLGIASSTGAAFVVAAAGDTARLASYTRGVLRQTAWMVIPAATAVALAAPYLLRLFGGGYASHAAGTLALLALSTIPNIVTTLYVRIYRVQKRMTAVVAALAAQCGLVLVLGPVLLAAIGISGVGLAWLVSQTFVALALVWLDPEALGLRTPAARAAGAPG